MAFDLFLDSVQTVFLIIVATVLSATFWMLRREFVRAGDTLRHVLASQQKLLDEQQHQIEELARVWIQTEANRTELGALKAEIEQLKRR